MPSQYTLAPPHPQPSNPFADNNFRIDLKTESVGCAPNDFPSFIRLVARDKERVAGVECLPVNPVLHCLDHHLGYLTSQY